MSNLRNSKSDTEDLSPSTRRAKTQLLGEWAWNAGGQKHNSGAGQQQPSALKDTRPGAHPRHAHHQGTKGCRHWAPQLCMHSETGPSMTGDTPTS